MNNLTPTELVQKIDRIQAEMAHEFEERYHFPESECIEHALKECGLTPAPRRSCFTEQFCGTTRAG